MDSLAFRSGRQLARAIRDRKVGCLELLNHYIARVERYDPAINAIVVRDFEGARRRARAADRALAKGDIWGPLHGVPMTFKESFDLAGTPTTWGIPALKDNIAKADSLAVQRFKAAGAVVFGKTNVPLGLADWQSFNAIYGTTNNPWDLSRGPGGSSGGSAAALAAGLTGIDAGSDIGASIRNPPHYCGVYGHKATYGIIPSEGHRLPGVFADADISVTGPLGRSADDLATGLAVMAGPTGIEARGWRLSLPPSPRKRLQDFRIAVVTDDRNAPVDSAIQTRLKALADQLRKIGARVSTTARPALDTDAVQRLYITVLRATTSRAQSDDEAARFADIAAKLPDVDQSYAARMARGVSLRHRDWLVMNNERHRMRLVWDAFFQEYDLLLCPTATTAAMPHNQAGIRHERTIEVNGQPQPVVDQLFWAGYSGFFYLPSTVAPNGRTADGLPVGVQIVGPQFADRTCITFAQLLEREFGGFVPPPAFAD